MKSAVYAILLAIAVGTLFIGCDKSSSGNPAAATCVYGTCYNTSGYGNGGLSPNAVILAGGVQVTDRAAWTSAIKGLGQCFNFIINFCSMVNETNPIITAIVDDYQFNGATGMSSGAFGIGSQQIANTTFNVNWRYSMNEDGQNHKGFDTQVLTPNGIGSLLRVEMIGLSTDANVPVTLWYGGKIIGTGTLVRVNR